MDKYKVHLVRYDIIRKLLKKYKTYCGTISYDFTVNFTPNLTNNWQHVTCKNCLKRLFKEQPYLKDVPRKGDIIRIGNSTVTILESEIVDKTFTVKYMKED